jgi:tripartite-type tricarboxylate transporter receptor subunit TctC
MNSTCRLAALAALFCTASLAHAQDYPTAPVHLISGFPAGSTADISARVVGAKMGAILGQQFVIENRLGAASSIAGAQVARAPKDGYTLYIASAANMINAAMSSNLNFDIMKDFEPVTLITSTPTVLVVTPELGVKSVKELIALAKAKPGTLSFGSSGVGSSTHLALELFNSLAGVKITHIPYTGSPQVVTDLLANRIHGYFSPASTVSGHVAAGKLVALGVTDAKRSTFFPELPTVIEAGVPDCVSVLWFGIAVPSGTPRPIIDTLSRAANEALKSDELIKALHAQTVEALGGTPEQFRKHMEEETARWTKVVEGAGLRK